MGIRYMYEIPWWLVINFTCIVVDVLDLNMVLYYLSACFLLFGIFLVDCT